MRHFTSVVRAGLLGCGTLLLAVRVTEAQCPANELAKLSVLKAVAANLWGSAVAIDRNIAIVGVWTDNDQANSSGAAWVFRRQGSDWNQEQKLRTNDGVAFDYFGASVAVSGSVALVGAPGEDDQGENSGAAYVYRYDGTTWVWEAKLLPSGGAADEHFGNAVGISGAIAVVGAWTDNDNGSAAGAAYVFRFNGAQWVQEAKLLASDGAAGDWFGRSLAISGSTVVIGAPYDGDNGAKSGSAYVFRYDGADWMQEAKLLAGDGAAGDWFGNVLAIHGDVVVVGAPYRSDYGPASGAAYVFRHSARGWAAEQKLLAAAGAAHDYFGYSVAVAGDLAVIGAALDGQQGISAGSAHVFRRHASNWVAEAKLLASNGAPYDFLGICAAVSGDTAVLGSCATDEAANQAQLAFVFGGLSDCNANGTLDICDIAAGTSLDTNGNGIPDECEPRPGDLNCDGKVSFADINPFVLALAGYEGYHAAYPGCRWLNADCNHDDVVDANDIIPFVEVLGGS